MNFRNWARQIGRNRGIIISRMRLRWKDAVEFETPQVRPEPEDNFTGWFHENADSVGLIVSYLDWRPMTERDRRARAVAVPRPAIRAPIVDDAPLDVAVPVPPPNDEPHVRALRATPERRSRRAAQVAASPPPAAGSP